MTYANGGHGDGDDKSNANSESVLVVRVLATLIVCAACLIAIPAGSCAYQDAVLPLRMAEKGYCQTGIQVPCGSASCTEIVWQPCDRKAKIE